MGTNTWLKAEGEKCKRIVSYASTLEIELERIRLIFYSILKLSSTFTRILGWSYPCFMILQIPFQDQKRLEVAIMLNWTGYSCIESIIFSILINFGILVNIVPMKKTQ